MPIKRGLETRVFLQERLRNAIGREVVCLPGIGDRVMESTFRVELVADITDVLAGPLPHAIARIPAEDVILFTWLAAEQRGQ